MCTTHKSTSARDAMYLSRRAGRRHARPLVHTGVATLLSKRAPDFSNFGMPRARSSPSAATCIRCALHRSLNLLCTRSAPTHAVGHVRWCTSSSFVRSRTPRARLTFDISAQQRRELASCASCCPRVHARHILSSCTFVTPALGSHAVVTVYNSFAGRRVLLSWSSSGALAAPDNTSA